MKPLTQDTINEHSGINFWGLLFAACFVGIPVLVALYEYMPK